MDDQEALTEEEAAELRQLLKEFGAAVSSGRWEAGLRREARRRVELRHIAALLQEAHAPGQRKSGAGNWDNDL